MNLPRAVREQAARAEALHQELLNGNTAPAAPQAPVVETPPVAPVVEVTPPATPPVAVDTTPTAPTPAPVEPAIADSWELKYRVLDGKYRAEVPRLSAEVADLKRTVADLTAQLQTRSAPGPVPAPTEALTKVKDQYGDDFAEAVASVAEAQVAPLREELSQAAATAAQTARQAFLSDLARLVPTFQTIDQEPGFTDFLNEFDPMTGRPRREFFNEADRTNDAPRIALFFANYLKAKTPAPAAAPVATPPAPAPAAPSVEHLIAPDSTAHSSAPPGKKLWTHAEINKFYADSRSRGAGKPFGIYTAEQYARIDRDIALASNEGRVVG